MIFLKVLSYVQWIGSSFILTNWRSLYSYAKSRDMKNPSSKSRWIKYMKKVSLEIGANPPQDRKSLTIPVMKSNFNVDRNTAVIFVTLNLHLFVESRFLLVPEQLSMRYAWRYCWLPAWVLYICSGGVLWPSEVICSC